MKKVEFLKHTADIGIKIQARNIRDLFIYSAIIIEELALGASEKDITNLNYKNFSCNGTIYRTSVDQINPTEASFFKPHLNLRYRNFKIAKGLINQATTKNQIVVAQFIEPNLKEPKYSPDKIIKFQLINNEIENLLVEFLNEIIYYLFAKKHIFNKIEVVCYDNKQTDISEKNTIKNLNYPIKLKVNLYSTYLKNIKFQKEIKACTYGGLSIKKYKNYLTAKIILDV